MSNEQILFITAREYLFHNIRYNLIKRGYKVNHAANEEDIAGQIALAKPQVVVIDNDLPFAEDLSICKTISDMATAPNLKFIVISPVATKQLAMQAAGFGIDNILIEPFTLEDIIEKIERIMGGEQNINVFRQAGHIILTLKGNLDHRFATRFNQVMGTICTIGQTHLVIDFSDVVFFAHQNILPLITAKARFERQGGKISIVGLNPGLDILFEKAMLRDTFRFHKDRVEALRS